jgi:hypothetical protein
MHRFEADHLDRLLGACRCAEGAIDHGCVMSDALFYVEAVDDPSWRRAAAEWLVRHGHTAELNAARRRRKRGGLTSPALVL